MKQTEQSEPFEGEFPYKVEIAGAANDYRDWHDNDEQAEKATREEFARQGFTVKTLKIEGRKISVVLE